MGTGRILFAAVLLWGADVSPHVEARRGAGLTGPRVNTDMEQSHDQEANKKTSSRQNANQGDRTTNGSADRRIEEQPSNQGSPRVQANGQATEIASQSNVLIPPKKNTVSRYVDEL